jgi:hypothetical protein
MEEDYIGSQGPQWTVALEKGWRWINKRTQGPGSLVTRSWPHTHTALRLQSSYIQYTHPSVCPSLNT